jgi:hypothetical protein
VLKVGRGVIQEIGIADTRLGYRSRAGKQFLATMR